MVYYVYGGGGIISTILGVIIFFKILNWLDDRDSKPKFKYPPTYVENTHIYENALGTISEISATLEQITEQKKLLSQMEALKDDLPKEVQVKLDT